MLNIHYAPFVLLMYLQKEVKLNRKNWFELFKTVISAALGYLAGVFL